MATRPDLFLFDLYGTTVRDDGQLLGAVESVCAESGLAAPTDWLIDRVSWRKRELFEAILMRNDQSTGRAPDLTKRFEELFEADFAERPPTPAPGAQEALDALEYAGVRVGFVSGFSRRTIDAMLEELGWFVFLSLSTDEVSLGRPAPDIVRAAMRIAEVSDARRVGVAGNKAPQLEAGSAAGCRHVIGVVGVCDRATLEATPYTHLVDDLGEVPNILLS